MPTILALAEKLDDFEWIVGRLFHIMQISWFIMDGATRSIHRISYVAPF